MNAVTRVTATDVAIPLPEPLKLGGFTVESRDYVLVEIETVDGLVGRGYALSRGAPVAACVRDLFAPIVVGADAAMVEEIWHRMYEATIAAGRVGLVMRAVSLVDIALWDVKAQQAGLPLWELLGGARRDVPVIIVAGYSTPSTSQERLLAGLESAASAGYALLKLARSSARDSFAELLHEADRRLPADVGLVVDAAWVWRTARDAVQELRRWPADRLRWVEDPFPMEQYDEYARWSSLTNVPVGAGDEVTDVDLLGRYIRDDRLDIIRIDPTTIGGITVARSLCGRTHRLVSTHTYPEIAIHLGQGLHEYGLVETFDDRSGAVNPLEPSRTFVRGGPTYRDGRATASERPGLGFDFDPDAVDRYTRRERR